MNPRMGSYHDGRLSAGDDPGVEIRIGLVGVVLIAVFAVFGLRLFQLQILQGADLRHRSERNHVRTVRVEAPRGEIVDREGRTLVTSRPAFAVGVIPNGVSDPELTYQALGQLLEQEPEALRQKVGAPRGRERFQSVVLDGDMPYDRMARVESHRYALPGVVTDNRPRRLYVEDRRAAHLLGTIGEIRAEQLEQRRFAAYRAGEVVGQRGLESILESHLRGHHGGRNLVVDVAGREIEVIDEVEPEPGGRVVLTLDLDLQRAAEEAFRAPEPDPDAVDPETGMPLPPEPDKMGAVVALDPRNGDVLALVSRPAYDPNDFAGGIDSDTWRQLTSDEWRPLQDRALTGQYPPGSTYKAIVAAAGLAEKAIDPSDTVYCPGHYRLGRRTYRCWRRAGHGAVDLEAALRESCDVYFYELGLRLGIDTIARYARAFGFGHPTGIDVSGEEEGLVPSSEWKERARKQKWIKGETISASIGQGFNLTTPLQLAVAYAAIANGGTPVRPRTILRTERWNGGLVEARPVRLADPIPVSAEDLAHVKQGLRSVVMAPRGTGGRARVKGVEVAGKTGTTQVVRLEQVEGLEDHEIPIKFRDHAWFAAFAPVEAPEIVVAVLVEHGGGGGAVAAPIAQKVLQVYFDKQAAKAAAAAEDGLAARSEDPEVRVARR